MKKFLITLTANLFLSLSFAQIIETFSFLGAANANGWTTHSGIASQIQALTTPSQSGNSLSYPGLQASVGNRIELNSLWTEDINKPIAIPGTTGYFSFLLNVLNTTGLSAGNYFIGFAASAGSSNVTIFFPRLYIKLGATPNTFQLGILNTSGGTVTISYDPTEYSLNTTLFVVAKATSAAVSSPITASLWVNPIPGAAEPGASATNASGTSSWPVNGIQSIFLRQATGTGNYEIDEIRVGTTWADVTPAGVASCNITASGLSSLTCNDAGTGAITTDDYLTFSLNPTGTLLGTSYTVSLSSGTITPTSGTYGAATSFQLQAGSAGAGNVVITLTDDGTSGCSTTENITDPGSCSSANPDINLNPSTLTGFDHNVGTPSAEQTFTASGLGLISDITLTAPTNFEISLTSGAGFTNSLTLIQTAGSVANTTIYIRGNSATAGAFNGDILGTSSGAANDTVQVSGIANDYVYSTIDLISTVDSNGVAVSLNQLVEVTGVVHCIDFDGNTGYSITLIDGSMEGINLFSFVDVSGYTSPLEGDSLRVFGIITQFNGLLQVKADSIEVLAQGVALMAPLVVTTLDESTESQIVKINNLTFVTPITTFPTGSNNIVVTDGTNTFTIRIDSDTDIPGAAAPQGPFNVIGVGGQFDNSSPYTSGYQLFPCGLMSFQPACVIPSNAITTSNPSTAMATAMGPGITYQWINCAGNTTIAGATSQSYTATSAGNYAVIVMAGSPTCSDTSSCIALVSSTQGLNENALFYSINVYPNPSNGAFIIRFNTSVNDGILNLTDINGKLILSKQITGLSYEINDIMLKKGIYFLTITSSIGTARQRVIIN